MAIPRSGKDFAKQREKFIEHLRQSGNVSESCKVAVLGRGSVYDWRKNDNAFAEQWDEAIEIAVDALEREARRRAIEGFDEPVFHKGEIVGSIRRYSDRMLELLLKGLRPDKFKDRVTMEHEVGENLAKRLESARKRIPK